MIQRRVGAADAVTCYLDRTPKPEPVDPSPAATGARAARPSANAGCWTPSARAASRRSPRTAHHGGLPRPSRPPRGDLAGVGTGAGRARVVNVDADVIVVGAGLAGLAATAELADAGRRVILLDQEPAASLGGQAFWSFGGLFLVDSPEQRRLGIRDSADLALQDWLGSAGLRPRRRRPDGRGLLGAASGPRRTSTSPRARSAPWLHGMGVRFFPVVGWAERGGHLADGHGNSVPRFHVTWGTGPGVVEPFERRVRAAVAAGRVQLKFRHRVDELVVTDGVVDRRARRRAGAVHRRARHGELAGRDRHVRARGAGRDRHHRRDRRRPRPRSAALARPPRHPAEAHDLRRARARRRAHARHQRGRGRAAGEPRPDVALHRGRPQLEPDLGAARHPDPARPVVAVVRRARAPLRRARTSPASTRSPRSARSPRPATTTRGSCSRTRSSRRSSRSRAPSRTPT